MSDYAHPKDLVTPQWFKDHFHWCVLNFYMVYSKVQNDDSSWNEWSRLPNLPTKAGP